MRIGDVSRPRRFADPARLRWYAHHRAVRFARRMGRWHHEEGQRLRHDAQTILTQSGATPALCGSASPARRKQFLRASHPRSFGPQHVQESCASHCGCAGQAGRAGDEIPVHVSLVYR